jgi:hypothetical protein
MTIERFREIRAREAALEIATAIVAANADHHRPSTAWAG